MWNDMENLENTEENSEQIWKKPKLKCEMIWKIQKKSWIVKWYGKYGRKASRVVKLFGKYGRKLWNVMEIMKGR